eukprot:CAMPEP_0171090758 /NCGR_PEP_ID=MMETSP0766_2-20121228/32048_1 /TAXON_ID=439317 /ORGANISM="Gambierdiscus australes, Strain CAWD 149" /LENGTH=171 /DNA_ID=CAMNT_0011548789 /DNA_START=182 /DNA_END=694 /DNA_ORIENTATION=+
MALAPSLVSPSSPGAWVSLVQVRQTAPGACAMLVADDACCAAQEHQKEVAPLLPHAAPLLNGRFTDLLPSIWLALMYAPETLLACATVVATTWAGPVLVTTAELILACARVGRPDCNRCIGVGVACCEGHSAHSTALLAPIASATGNQQEKDERNRAGIHGHRLAVGGLKA